MDSEAFRDYLEKNILHLYPDVSDEPGKRVCIKCDGGPGRLDWFALLSLRQRGVLIYPTVPNATHVIQELDVSYGSFQSMVRENSQTLLNERVAAGLPRKINKHD